MTNFFYLRNGLPRTAAAIERREFFAYYGAMALRVLAYLTLGAGIACALLMIGCATWLGFINAITIEASCPIPNTGERLIARYYTPDGTVSCRYASLGVTRAEQIRTAPAVPFSK